MKIYGHSPFEGEIASAPSVVATTESQDVSAANQQTLPSRPLAEAMPRATLGDSGTRMLHGIITEDYNPQLQGIQGIRVFDEMRKSDGTVRAAVAVCTLPILAAQWFVNPASDEQTDKDVANFVEHALFDWLDQSWDDTVRQALLMLPFGVMVFEKVYEVKEHDGKSYVTLAKLAPRLPKSILRWELADRTFGIEQIRQDGILAEIPGSKLVVFVHEREGDNWWGTSLLRAPYKHWYYKNNFYKIDAIAFERQGIGVPLIKMPVGYTDADEKRAQRFAQNLRSNEAAYGIIPQGYEATFMDMGARTTRDPSTSIDHHNKEILQSVLAQFLELGASKSSSGSRALSQDHSDLFLTAMVSVANTVANAFNKQLVKELVDLNFDGVKVYPVLDFSGIKKVDVAALGTAIAQLTTAGAIHPTDDDEQYIRAAMGMPPRSQEDIDAAADDEPSSEEQADHADIEDADVEPTESADVSDAAANADARDVQPPDAGAKTAKAAAKSDAAKTPAPPRAKKPSAKKPAPKKAREHKPLPRVFTDSKGFTTWRPLTFAEGKVNWQGIQDKMDALESGFSDAAKTLLGDAKDAFMAKLHAAIASGDSKAVTALTMDFASSYKSLLKSTMQQAYEYGKTTAATEMGIAYPPNSADTLATIDTMAQTIADKTASDLETRAKLAAANAIRTGSPALQASGSIDASLDDAIGKAVDKTTGSIVAQNVNGGRNDAIQRNASNVASVQRSEVLDDATCNFCLSVDGLVLAVDDPDAQDEQYHDNCRGIWVQIMDDEQDQPEITGIPDAISSLYGGTPNDLEQPRNPIVRPGSLAAKVVEERKAAGK